MQMVGISAVRLSNPSNRIMAKKTNGYSTRTKFKRDLSYEIFLEQHLDSRFQFLLSPITASVTSPAPSFIRLRPFQDTMKQRSGGKKFGRSSRRSTALMSAGAKQFATGTASALPPTQNHRPRNFGTKLSGRLGGIQCKFTSTRAKSAPGRHQQDAVSSRTLSILEGMMKKANLSQHQIRTMKSQIKTTGVIPKDVSYMRSGTYKPMEKRMSRREIMNQPMKKFYARRRSHSQISDTERRYKQTNRNYAPVPLGRDTEAEKDRLASFMETNGGENKK
eukprot:jgi/Bigna1/73656/fgenesh1_pg.25_\